MAPAAEDGTPVHRTRTRVRYPETDRMGVAYHAHYLVWFELGRTEMMRAVGAPYGELEDEAGILFPVIEAGARYLRPARYDDVVAIDTTVRAVGGARVRFEYALSREADGEQLATGFTEHASVGRDGRPTRLPAELRERLLETREGE